MLTDVDPRVSVTKVYVRRSKKKRVWDDTGGSITADPK